MPKVQPSIFDERKRIVRSCIAANMERYAITDEQMAKCLAMTVQTFKKRKADPTSFTLFELQLMSKILKFTPIQAASIVLGRDLTAREFRDFILH